jgi:cytoskeletal protein RodZ
MKKINFGIMSVGVVGLSALLGFATGCKSDKVAVAEKAIAAETNNVKIQAEQIRAGQADVRESLRDIKQHQQQLDQAQIGLTAAYDEYSLRVRERLARIQVRVAALPLSIDVTKRTDVTTRYQALVATVATTNAVTVPNWDKFRTDTTASFEALERDLLVLEH